jgi:hypothetical protein
LSHEVIGVEEVEGGAWSVRMKDWNQGGRAVLDETWDTVVVTTLLLDNPTFPTYKVSKNCNTNNPTNPAFHNLAYTKVTKGEFCYFCQSFHNQRLIHGITSPGRARHRKCKLS